MKPRLTNHHFAITVNDFGRSLEFYGKLGFEVIARKESPDKGKKLALLGLNDMKIEIFWWADSEDKPETRTTMGNNVKEVGAKHLAIQVDSVEKTIQFLEGQGIPLASEPDLGDAGYTFFFVQDPDGIWLEFVHDEQPT